MKSGEQLHNPINKTTFQVSRVFTGPLLYLRHWWEKETALLATKM